MTKHNIIYILVDQQRWDMLGTYGHHMVQTPHLDKLAQDGLRFNNAFTPTSICGPARTSLFTGQVPTAHSVTQNAENGHSRFRKADPLPHLPTMGDYLDSYDKIYLGKWHIAETKLPSDYGFRGHNFPGYGYPGSLVYKNMVFDQGPGRNNRYHQWLHEKGFEIPAVSESFCGMNPELQIQELRGKLSGPPEATLPAFLVDEAQRCLDHRDKTEPFFLWMNFWGPHTPCVIPEPYYSMYDRESIVQDPSFKDSLFSKPLHQKHVSHMWGVHDLDWNGWCEIIACYWGYITMIDHYMGEFITYLKKNTLYDETSIVFTSDHGDAMGAHKLIEKGEFMYDETYRIPMIITSPHVQNPGSCCDEFVYLHDLFPTLMSLAGEKGLELNQAQSLLPLITDSSGFKKRDFVYGQFTGHFTDYSQRMIRTHKYKLIFNAPSIGELYDLRTDPHEMNNLINHPDYGAIKRSLIDQLLEECQKLDDPMSEWIKRIKGIY